MLGHPEYYPKLGFSAQAAAQVKSPYSGSPAFMALGARGRAPDGPLLVAYPTPSAAAKATSRPPRPR